MPLATKNNAIIVKDGKLAEGCGCCGGICVCDATAVTVSISADNFLRHLLLRNSFGAEARVSLGFIAAPSSGVHVLRKDTVATEAGLSASKWVSADVPSPGQGRITAVVYRAASNAPVRVTVGIPIWYWRSVGSSFKSLAEMLAESNSGNVLGQGFGTLVVELECDSQSGASRVFSLRHIADTAWSPDGSTIPLLACDFSKTNGLQSDSAVWWEGRRLLKGDERLLSPGFGFSVISDTRTGSNIVTLDGLDIDCCEDEPEGACCEGTTCTVKPQCQCQGTGKVFKGVGTTCTPNPCLCCCEFFDLRVGGAQVSQEADSSCVASNNKKPSACSPTPLVVSVSGFTDVSVPGEPGFFDGPGQPQIVTNRSLSFANTSRTTPELCGQSGLSVEGPVGAPADFYVISSELAVSAWFSPYDNLHDLSSDRCSSGSVRLRVQLTLSRLYGLDSSRYPLVYRGYYKGDCTSLDSYPASLSMLAGNSVTMTCDGLFSVPGSGTYAAVPQTITVSFAANPLP